MNWTELIDHVAERAGVPKTHAKRILDAASSEIRDAVARGEAVAFKDLGRIEVRELKPRAIRKIDDQRKYYLGKRFGVRIRPAARLKRAAASLGSTEWKSPKHQAAWRRAETLISDLDLYHGKDAPQLADDLSTEQVIHRLRTAFGSRWRQVQTSFDREVDASVEGSADYLAQAAVRRWAR